jgi:hypothetical protein
LEASSGAGLTLDDDQGSLAVSFRFWRRVDDYVRFRAPPAVLCLLFLCHVLEHTAVVVVEMLNEVLAHPFFRVCEQPFRAERREDLLAAILDAVRFHIWFRLYLILSHDGLLLFVLKSFQAAVIAVAIVATVADDDVIQ